MKPLPQAAIDLISEFDSHDLGFHSPRTLRASLIELFKKHFGNVEDLRAITLLIESLFLTEGTGPISLSFKAHERLYAEKILGLRPYVDYLGRPPRASVAMLHTGQDEDFLAYHVDNWSLVKFLNFCLTRAIRATRKIAVIASVRDEGLTILEWLAHYRALGIFDFFIYTNDNTDGSDALLERLAAQNIIRLIRNETAPQTPVQAKVTEHSLQFLPEARDFEWAFYIDNDEFLILPKGAIKIDDFWADIDRAFQGSPPSAIGIHWKWFGSENCFARDKGLLLQRFIYSIPNEHVKSFVRLRDVVSMHRVHIPDLLPGKIAVRSDFTPMATNSATCPPVYDRGQLNHYWNQSFEEFFLRKKRGRIAFDQTMNTLEFETFFNWGNNSRRGQFDAPPASIIQRTATALIELLSVPGVAALQLEIEKQFETTYRKGDGAKMLRNLYQHHGAALGLFDRS